MDNLNMKICVWNKVYSYLNYRYFISHKMIVILIYSDEYVAIYKIIRNSKIVSTRLDDFIKHFSIINYRK